MFGSVLCFVAWLNFMREPEVLRSLAVCSLAHSTTMHRIVVLRRTFASVVVFGEDRSRCELSLRHRSSVI